MSTRCQVLVIADGASPFVESETHCLYHHTDGYPSNIVPLLQQAAKLALKSSATVKYAGKDKKGYTVSALPWEAGRTGKVAGVICATDPLVFEPEANELHGDIAYLYKLFVVGPSHSGAKVRWDLEIRRPLSGFWDKPSEKKTEVILKRTPLHVLNGKQIEDALKVKDAAEAETA